MKYKLLKFICTAAFMVCGGMVHAQKCIVYSIIGKVSTVNGNKQKAIHLRETLNMNTTIMVSQNSIIELFDETNRKKYVISTQGSNTIANMLKDKRNETIGLTERYFKYIMANIKNNNETIVQTCSDIANVTREVLIDSTMHVTESEE